MALCGNFLLLSLVSVWSLLISQRNWLGLSVLSLWEIKIIEQPPKAISSFILLLFICFCLKVYLSFSIVFLPLPPFLLSFFLLPPSVYGQIMTARQQKSGRERERGKDLKWQSSRETKADERRETKKWESWRVALEEMKSDLLVQRMLGPRCWLGNGLVLLILCVCVCYFEIVCVCVYLPICICFLVSLSLCVCSSEIMLISAVWDLQWEIFIWTWL